MGYSGLNKEGPSQIPNGSMIAKKGNNSLGVVEASMNDSLPKESTHSESSVTFHEPISDQTNLSQITGEIVSGFSTEVFRPSDMIRSNIPGLGRRGINSLKPYIICTMKFIPVLQNESSNSENLSLRLGDDHSVKVNQVLRLIELHRSINKIVKATAEKIITQSVVTNKQEITRTFQDTDIDFRSLYNQIENESLTKTEFSNKILDMLSASKMISITTSLFENHGFQVRAFTDVSIGDIESAPGNFYDKVLENSIKQIKNYGFRFSNDEDIEELNKRMFLYFVKNNDNFGNSIQFQKIVEISLVNKILKIFKQYVLGAHSLKQKYSDAIDLNILSNEYGPQETLGTRANSIIEVINGVRSTRPAYDLNGSGLIDVIDVDTMLGAAGNVNAQPTIIPIII